MKIVMNNTIREVLFIELNIGDIFMYNNLLFMKIEPIYKKYNDKYERVNAVRLDSGVAKNFFDEAVISIKGEFVVS